MNKEQTNISRHQLTFYCPKCKGGLSFNGEVYQCEPCHSRYPVVLGIPDFRVYPDPYINFEEDRDKGKRIAEKYNSMNFNELVKYYWKITPDVPAELANRFARYAYMGVERGYNSLRMAESLEDSDIVQRNSSLLELGCGTGGLLVAANTFYKETIGVDIAFRWLVIARKRLEEVQVSAKLICCCAEYLPFPEGYFDTVIAVNVIEHTQMQQELFQESSRVLSRSGKFFALTVNRFSLTPEPHVRVWGVGFLPRKLMSQYVYWMKQVPYKNIKTLSYFELQRILRYSDFQKYSVSLPDISKTEFQQLTLGEKFQVILYRALKGMPIIRGFLLLMGPVFSIIAYKQKNHNSIEEAKTANTDS